MSRASVLKEYYGRYLKEIRGSKDSTVRHYQGALNTVSRWLKEKGLVREDIYEIRGLDELTQAREILFQDEEFRSLDERGRRMYSAGFNNYLRFASGKEFANAPEQLSRLDIPLEPEEPRVVETQVYPRSEILRLQALTSAGFQCEMDAAHQTFVAEETGKPYMEGHHAIPMRLQPRFDHSLDVYANIVCLCPICHRRIHHGTQEDRRRMGQQIYVARADRLASSGIRLGEERFLELMASQNDSGSYRTRPCGVIR